jgi:hypothetical protein
MFYFHRKSKEVAWRAVPIHVILILNPEWKKEQCPFFLFSKDSLHFP